MTPASRPSGLDREARRGPAGAPATGAPAPGAAGRTSGAPPRCCVEYARDGLARFLSHLDLQEGIERCLRRAGVPLAFTQGFHPRPRLSFEDPLPLGWRSACERFWVELERPYPARELLRRIAATAPPGVEYLRAYPLLRPEPPRERRYRVRGLSLPPDPAARLASAFPAEAGAAAPVTLEPEAEGPGVELTLRPCGARPAPSLKKVLAALLGSDPPADADVLRLAWPPPPGPGEDSR